MNGLIGRLRSLGKTHDDMSVGEEAADEIVRLQAELERTDNKLYKLVSRKSGGWFGLTAEDIKQGKESAWLVPNDFESAVMWAEATLREKNT